MNSSTSLHRQIHPSWVDNNEVSSQAFDVSITSQAFTPTAKDDNKLSVSNGEKINPKNSYDAHIAQGLKSAGVMSVLGNECDSIQLSYEEDNDPYEGHSFIDYSKCTSKTEVRAKAKVLKAFAIKRGWTHKPDSPQETELKTA